MTFKLTKQYGNNREMDCGQFKDLISARKAMQTQAGEDAILKVKAVYRLYEWDDLIEEVHSADMATGGAASSGDDSGGNSMGGRPTPLSSVPRPPGMPASWNEHEDDDGKKE